jgi:hypothetical protein
VAIVSANPKTIVNELKEDNNVTTKEN